MPESEQLLLIRIRNVICQYLVWLWLKFSRPVKIHICLVFGFNLSPFGHNWQLLLFACLLFLVTIGNFCFKMSKMWRHVCCFHKDNFLERRCGGERVKRKYQKV